LNRKPKPNSPPRTSITESVDRFRETDEAQAQPVDIAAKFGASAALTPVISTNQPSATRIPTESEIAERKARRAKLKAEHDYISLEDAASPGAQAVDDDIAADHLGYGSDDPDFRIQRGYLRKDDLPEDEGEDTRLIRDDADILEGYEAYVEDDGLNLGRKAQKEARERKRAEIADMIAAADRGDMDGADGDESETDSDAEREGAFEAAQARAAGITSRMKSIDVNNEDVGLGGYGTLETGSGNGTLNLYNSSRKTKEIPDLPVVKARFQKMLNKLKEANAARQHRLDEIEMEKKQISERETYIQTQLKETAERYDKLRVEAGIASTAGSSGALTPLNDVGATAGLGSNMRLSLMGRGLESLGATPLRNEVGSDKSEDGSDENQSMENSEEDDSG
jgi:hypothetical protein